METQNPTKVLNKFKDVINLNAFIASGPQKARLIYKISTLTGLWQLDLLVDEESLWSVGHYIDGFEDVSVEYDVVMKRRWRDYVVEEFNGERRVLWTAGGFIFVAVPHMPNVAVPQVCNRTDPLKEPIYIWREPSCGPSAAQPTPLLATY